MWIATNIGFFSVVVKQEGPKAMEVVHIRGRVWEDLDNLRRFIQVREDAKSAPDIHPGQLKVLNSHPGSDYPYRMIFPKSALPVVLGMLAESVTYDNFKREIHCTPDQSEKSAAYGGLWEALYQKFGGFFNTPPGPKKASRKLAKNARA